MKNVLKKPLSLLLALCLLSTFALADGSDATADTIVEIQLNGELMEYNSGVRPYFDTETNRTFVPFRDLFEAMGATVAYDEDTRIITATRGDTVVSFNQSGVELTVVTNGVTSTITSDVAPLTIDGRTMVPVRFASQAFGANVGWDQASKTVIVIDTPIVTEAMMSDFTYLAQLAELGQLAEGQTQKVVADFTGAIVVEDIEISFAMDILMLMNLKNADGKVDAEFTVPEELGGSMEFSMDMLMDLEGGTYYINSELLNEMFGAGAGTWFRLNLLELATLAGGDIGDIAGLGNLGITTLAGIEDIISESINSFELTSIDDYAMIMDDLALAKEILGDGAFVADGDSRTATISEDGIDITVSVTLENGAVVGYAIDLNIVDEYSGTISLYMAISAGTGSMKLVAEMDGVSMTMELEATYSDTDEAVRTAPPTGAPIVNAVELLTLAMMLAQSNV